MSINLKQILITDTDNIKLDKVNYNFDQLVSNGGGPQGPQGSVGETGPIGITGAQGIQGAQGVKGDQGIKGLDGGGHWSLVKGNLTENSTSDVLYPISGDVAPKVVLGYLNTDSAYSAENNKSVLTLHRKNDFISNLRLLNLDSSDAFDWISDVINNETVVTAKFNTTNNNKFINFADKFIFKATGADVLNLNRDILNINVNTTFENDITIDGNLKITSGDPTVDKSGFVAVSNDNQGTLVFKDTEVLGGSAPVGTIVSILPNIFDNNFKKSEEYTIENANEELLKVSLGAGLNDYKGWYICNGKTWTNGSDINYTTPDLNSFSYEIEDNPDSNTPDTSQGFAKVENSESSILGGANISMEAIWNSGVYNISQTTEIDDDSLNSDSTDPDTTFDIKRFPQIIYLGVADLYWEDAGSDWAPLTTVTHTFTDLNPNVEYSSTRVHEAPSGTSGSFNKFINPPDNYYWNVNNLPTMIPPLPDGYTIGSVVLVPASTDPGPYNERLKITVNYDSHPGVDKEIYFTFDSTNHLILIPESTIILTVDESTVPNVAIDKPIVGSYTSILPVASNNPILGFDGNKYIIDAGQAITADAYDDASIEIINTNTGNPSNIVATKRLFNDTTRDVNKIEWTFEIASGDWPAGGNTETHEIVIGAINLLRDRMDFTVIANDITTINIAIRSTYTSGSDWYDIFPDYDGNQPAAENDTVGTSTEEVYNYWIPSNPSSITIEFEASTPTFNQQIEYAIKDSYGDLLAGTRGNSPQTTDYTINNPNSSNINGIVIEAFYYNPDIIEDPNTPIDGLTAIQLYPFNINVCDIPSTSLYYINNTSFINATEIYVDDDNDGNIYAGDQPNSGWFNDGNISKLWSVEDGAFTQLLECTTDTDGGDIDTIQLYNITLYEPQQSGTDYQCDTQNPTQDYSIDSSDWLSATKLYYRGTDPAELVQFTKVLNNGPRGWARQWDGSSFESLGTCGGDGTDGTGGDASTSTTPQRFQQDLIRYEHKPMFNVNNNFDVYIGDIPTLENQEPQENAPEFPVFSDDQFMQGDIVNYSSKPIEVWPTLFSNKDMMDADDNDKILPVIKIYYKKYELDGNTSNPLAPKYVLDDQGVIESISLLVGWDNKHTLGQLATRQEAWEFAGNNTTYDPNNPYSYLVTPLVGWDSIEISPNSLQRNADGTWYRYGTKSGEGIHLKAGERVFIAGWTWNERIDFSGGGTEADGIFTTFDAQVHFGANYDSYNSPAGELALGFTYKQTGDTADGEWDRVDGSVSPYDGSEHLGDRHLPYPVVDPFSDNEYAVDIDDQI